MKQKILIVASKIPYPTIDGTRYKILNNIAKELQRDFDVDFLIVTYEKASDAQLQYFREHFGRTTIIHIPKICFVLKPLIGIFSKLPLQVSRFYSARAARWVRSHIHEYASAYVHTIRLTEHFIRLPEHDRRKLVIDLNDAISLHYKEAASKARFWLRPLFSLESRRVLAYEKVVLAAFSNFNIIAHRDMNYLHEHMPSGVIPHNMACIPHGVPTDLVNRTPQPVLKTLVFVGNLGYEPNWDAVTYFLKTIWPSLYEAIPGITLSVIGRGNRFDSATPFPGVQFLGYVEDIHSVIETSMASIAPIRFGAGMLSKITEAMALGVPVITTPAGAAGIKGLQDTINVRIVSDTDEWIAAVQKFVEQPEYAKAMGSAGRTLIEKSYTEKVVGDQFRQLFAAAVENRSIFH